MNANGSGKRQITRDPELGDKDPALSPDGSKIAFSSNAADGTRQMFLIGVDGNGSRRSNSHRHLESAAQQGNDERPEFSPNGQRIVFTSDRDGNKEVYAIAADGSNQVRLFRFPGADIDAEYSPDGTKIIWDRSRPSREKWTNRTDAAPRGGDGACDCPTPRTSGARYAPHTGKDQPQCALSVWPSSTNTRSSAAASSRASPTTRRS